MLKNKSVILFLIFFVPLVLSGQIDTNRTVNGFGVTEKTSNINVGFSEMSPNSNTILGSYLSQKFVIGKTGISKKEEITWKKDFKNQVTNIPDRPILLWIYLEKLGNSFPNDSSFTIDIYFLVDSSYFLIGRWFIPGWIYTVWYPVGGVSSSQFGNKKIQGIKFVFNEINVSETIVLLDNLGWTDDAYQVPYILEAFEDTTIVGIENEPTVPSSFKLYQNYPNPFNPETKIRFELSSTKFVKLQVFDALGCEIVTLVNEEKLPGIYEVKFDASRLPSGTYFYRLTSGQYSETRKIIYLK
jgi:hypothetical protein